MIKTSTFQIQIVCPGCNNYHAVSGIADTDICQNCGKNIDVAGILHERMFAMMDRVKYMNAFVSGSIEQMGVQELISWFFLLCPPIARNA
jgi:hypothetical protein